MMYLRQPRSPLLPYTTLFRSAHQCNWEWMLLALSLELGYPLDAAYKPLVDNWAEREMKKLRTRFGSRLVRSEEHTSELQSPDHIVCRLMLEKIKSLSKLLFLI